MHFSHTVAAQTHRLIAKITVHKPALTSFSLTHAKLLVRVVGRSSFDLVKSFTHGRLCNAIFGRCWFSDFLKTLTVKHDPGILTFLQVSGWNFSIYVKQQSFEVREFSVISFVLIAFCQPQILRNIARDVTDIFAIVNKKTIFDQRNCLNNEVDFRMNSFPRRKE